MRGTPFFQSRTNLVLGISALTALALGVNAAGGCGGSDTQSGGAGQGGGSGAGLPTSSSSSTMGSGGSGGTNTFAGGGTTTTPGTGGAGGGTTTTTPGTGGTTTTQGNGGAGGAGTGGASASSSTAASSTAASSVASSSSTGGDPCTPNPCTTPPANTCNGPEATTYPNPGTCVNAGGQAQCTYTPTQTNCAQQNEACSNGACIDPCVGFACTTPPANTCAGNTLTSYAPVGTCTSPQGVPGCNYPPTQTDCTLTQMVCTNGACVPAAPTCSDGIKNGLESDVDCGGGVCSVCADGKACVLQTDCDATSTCTTGLCACTLHIVVNEVQVAGAGGSGDEFIEIYNPCISPLDISGYRLVYRSAAGTSDTGLVTFAAGTTIPGGGYLLYAGQGYTGQKDGTFGSTNGALAGAGGAVAIRDVALNIVDSVGYGTATNAFVEGTVVAAPASGQSIARTPNGHDTNNNSTDFAVVITPTPRAAN